MPILSVRYLLTFKKKENIFINIYTFILCLVCRKPLGNNEKKFVIRWIQNKRPGNDGVIRWTKIVRSMKATFNKTYSENDVKNFWYSNMRKQEPKKRRKAAKPRPCSHPSEKVLYFNQNLPTNLCPTIVNPPETDV